MRELKQMKKLADEFFKKADYFIKKEKVKTFWDEKNKRAFIGTEISLDEELGKPMLIEDEVCEFCGKKDVWLGDYMGALVHCRSCGKRWLTTPETKLNIN